MRKTAHWSFVHLNTQQAVRYLDVALMEQLCQLGRYSPQQKPNVALIEDINNKSPWKIDNDTEQKILPGGIIFNQ